MSLSSTSDRYLSCFHDQMSRPPPFLYYLFRSDYVAEAIRLLGWNNRWPDLNYHWLLYLTGNINARLITRLKDIVLWQKYLLCLHADLLNGVSHLECIPDMEIGLNSGNTLLCDF